jgi:glutamate--cysteine ligase
MQEITNLLLRKIEENQALIDNWFAEKFSINKPIFYNSVDLRHSRFKIAPVDTNCFPAGFNNLSDSSRQEAKKVCADFFAANFPDAKKILIIPENHTRNIKYLENVLALYEIIAGDSDKEVVIGSLIEEDFDQLVLDLENSQKIILHKLIKNSNQIQTKSGFIPDLIISNNDFTNGEPEILKNISTPIIPGVAMGWHLRRKSTHFNKYNQIVGEFSKLIDIDPWLISTMHLECHNIDFKEKKGVKDLAKYIDELLLNLKKKYREHDIKEEPYCYVKADNGTYGMAMMTVKSGAEILEINKKDRNKMNVIKGSVLNTRVIIQEGISTIDKVKNIIAEPLIYLINGQVIGNLFRVNDQRDANISLNSAGMGFHDISNLKDEELSLGLTQDKIIKIYALISRLAALAAAAEN